MNERAANGPAERAPWWRSGLIWRVGPWVFLVTLFAQMLAAIPWVTGHRAALVAELGADTAAIAAGMESFVVSLFWTAIPGSVAATITAMALILLGVVWPLQKLVSELAGGRGEGQDEVSEVRSLVLRLESERAKAETAERVAREAEAAKTHFIACVSHEFHTPLRGIRSRADLVLGATDNVTVARDVEWIGSAAQHLDAMVDDVMMLQRGSEFITVTLRDFDVIDVVQEALAVERARHGHLHFAFRSLSRSVPLRSDAAKLSQCLLNLLSNAANFAKERVDVGVWETGEDEVEIRITDDGPGVDADALERIFEPFVQLDAPLSGDAGAGLGLAITRDLVQAVGGTVRAERQSGGGATFILRVPNAEVAGGAGGGESGGATRIAS